MNPRIRAHEARIFACERALARAVAAVAFADVSDERALAEADDAVSVAKTELLDALRAGWRELAGQALREGRGAEAE